MNIQGIYEGKAGLYGQFINEWLLPFVPSGSKVLDVGCSFGLFGERLIKQKQCIVHGVDISRNAIEVARNRLTEAACMDIENDELPFGSQHYDIIVFADVLEHLLYPDATLAKFKPYLKPSGAFLISLPNIANIRYRIRLLFGRWNYQDGGILDRTHLHFYTKKTALMLVTSQGFQISRIGATPGFVINGRCMKAVRPFVNKLSQLYPSMFANQFIIEATCAQNDK